AAPAPLAQRHVREPRSRVPVLDPQPLDQLRRLRARLGKRLARALAERARERVALPHRRGPVPHGLHSAREGVTCPCRLCADFESVADDDLRAHAENARPRDRGVTVYLRVARAAGTTGAEAKPLEKAPGAAREPGDPQVPIPKLAAEVVHLAERPPGLGHQLAPQQLRETHQEPGTFPTSLDQRGSPRSRRSPEAGRLSVTTDETDSTSDQGTCTASPASRLASLPSSPRVRQALPPTRISTTSGESVSSPVSSRSSTLPQLIPFESTSWWSRIPSAMSTSACLLPPGLRSSRSAAGWPPPRWR